MLTRRDVQLKCNLAQQEAFDKLKRALSSETVLAHPNFELPFILSCDASNYAISAILSQKQNGSERPISFASRMLNKHEVNYSTTHKELLAVIFGTKIHRCFLYGRKFQIVTDHAALKWLITVKNHQCARLTRWILKLSEYEFDIIYKPGKQHVNADVLSRHVGVINGTGEVRQEINDLELSLSVIAQEQSMDENCVRLRAQVERGSTSRFHIDEHGILVYQQTDGRKCIFVPKTLVPIVIHHHHDKIWAGHQGITRTQELIKLRYYWPSLRKDVESYVNKCHSCARYKSGRVVPAPLGSLPETNGPFEFTSIDICGPYPVTARGNRYLLTFVDHFSRFPEAIPIPRQDAETVARALITGVFSRYGCPKALSSDRGTNFMSDLFQMMCKLLNVERLLSTAFNPKMQGKVEKFHFGLNQTMSHYVNKYGNDWDDFVDYALMAHRAVPHTATKYSPYYLLYGREMRLPTVEDLTPLGPEVAPINDPTMDKRIAEHLNTLRERLLEAYRVVIANNQTARERQKEYYDKDKKLRTFESGDWVYVKEMSLTRKQSSKFRVRWKGPYRVLRRLSDLTYLIKIGPSKEKVININRMKRCKSIDEGESLPQTAERPTVRSDPIRTDEGTGDEEDEPLVDLTPRLVVPYDPPVVVDSRDVEVSDETELNGDDQMTEIDQSTLDPTWVPTRYQQHTVEGREDGYNLRPRAHADLRAGGSRPANDAAAPETSTGRENGRSSPYDLRPLPGRRTSE
jgi:transposase InsO family protein